MVRNLNLANNSSETRYTTISPCAQRPKSGYHQSSALWHKDASPDTELIVDSAPPVPTLSSYNLADTLKSTPPLFKEVSKRKPIVHDTTPNAESLKVSSPFKLTKPKRPSRPNPPFLAQKSVSSPFLLDLHTSAIPPPYTKHPEHAPSPSYPLAASPYSNPQPHPHMNSDTEDDDDSSIIYTSRLGSSSITPSSSSSNHLNVGSNSNGHAYTRASSSQSLRSRIFSLASSASSSRVRDKPICTTPGVLCAGETETETDEPSRALPTARIILPSLPLIPPSTLEQRLTPLLFEFARLLSIVPAVFGTLYNIYFLIWPPKQMAVGRPPPERIDYFISALWAILTGYQCLALATGLLTRWRLYYPPLSTLVRLLALQGICWPATHLTLTVLGHEVRPVVTWAVIGTTTCCSRSIQIWVTSNLWWERRGAGDDANPSVSLTDTASSLTSTMADASSASTVSHTPLHKPPAPAPRQTYWKRWGGGGKWGGRRWDWREVGVKCALPAGVVYFIMAWAEQLRRELAVGGGLSMSSTYKAAGVVW